VADRAAQIQRQRHVGVPFRTRANIDRVDGVTGPPLLDAVADAMLLFGDVAAGAPPAIPGGLAIATFPLKRQRELGAERLIYRCGRDPDEMPGDHARLEDLLNDQRIRGRPAFRLRLG
jgi:hypothetical protein